MLSIAMTTYNGGAFIEKQLESLLNQKRKPDEVVIVDDCSKDETVELIKEFIKKNQLTGWKLYVNDENLGYKKNFYKSIEKTQGDLIFLCDQDDIWNSDKLARMAIIFDKYPQILSLNTTFELINQEEQPIEYRCRKGSYNNDLIRGKCLAGKLKKIPYEIIMEYNISPGCTMAFRKSVKDIYLQQSLSRLPHDWELNIIAASQEGLFFYNKPLIKYRIHDKNTLGMNTDDSISDFEFQGNIDFRKMALEDRKLFKLAMDEWNGKLNISTEQKQIYDQITAYDKLRMNCVYDRKLASWFALVLKTIRLWDGKHIRFKTLFGDLYYILRKNKGQR
ncbi:glycosyltransferase [Frisingicoccus sp.]|uniref:glycosyltransferase n=1 Tax=Frisingicoccus sp. TaxID=1918627 RepID=UPI002E782A61|nr:glycosyltransferase [Frisingicoccus sp.]MEE0751422.1 glycosyltransferase [Frisingicoccus sp.]